MPCSVQASTALAVMTSTTASWKEAAMSATGTNLLLGGGVAANSRLHALTEERCRARGITLRVPPIPLCTDNGAMVAALGAQVVMAGAEPSGLRFAPDPSMPVTSIHL